MNGALDGIEVAVTDVGDTSGHQRPGGNTFRLLQTVGMLDQTQGIDQEPSAVLSCLLISGVTGGSFVWCFDWHGMLRLMLLL